jgi:sialic acid synthase SpsE
MPQIRIADRWVGDDHATYFIADISANHDGSLERACQLVRLAAQAGADAAKFQNFQAAKIVSSRGFESLGGQLSHQAKWKKPVFQVYQDASIPWDWTPVLKAECDRSGIHYLSTPYDFGAVDMLDPYVPAFKIGSGDITWPEMLRKVASKGKPVLIAAGASDMTDVARAMNVLGETRVPLGLMQCNTNYSASAENFRHIHLRVLQNFGSTFPDAVLGLSDHTFGHATVLGAVALGARVIEKHFTDDITREGPDHPFSMTPQTWREMVDRTRELELSLGSSKKEIAANERDTVVVQRRCLRAARDLPQGTILSRDMIDVLRPAPLDGIFPYEIDLVIGSTVRQPIGAGQHLRWAQLEVADRR